MVIFFVLNLLFLLFSPIFSCVDPYPHWENGSGSTKLLGSGSATLLMGPFFRRQRNWDIFFQPNQHSRGWRLAGGHQRRQLSGSHAGRGGVGRHRSEADRGAAGRVWLRGPGAPGSSSSAPTTPACPPTAAPAPSAVTTPTTGRTPSVSRRQSESRRPSPSPTTSQTTRWDILLQQ